MFGSLRHRLTLSYLAVIGLAMSIAAALAWSALDRAFLDVLRENLLAQARRVAQTVESGYAAGDADGAVLSTKGATPASDEASATPSPDPPPSLDTSSGQALNVMPGIHTRVIDDESLVMLDEDLVAPDERGPSQTTTRSYELPAIMQLDMETQIIQAESRQAATAQPLNERDEVRKAFAGQPATAVRSYTWEPRRRVLYAAYPIRSNAGEVTGVAYIASPLPRVNLSLLPDYLGRQILGGAAAGGALALLAGLLLARQLARPIGTLTKAAETLSKGQEPAPIPPARTRELNRLGEAFNRMNTNLATAQAALAAQARERQTILEGLVDAVLAYDADGAMVFANPAAVGLLNEGQSDLTALARQAMLDQETMRQDIACRDQVYEMTITPLPGTNGPAAGAVAIAHNVTANRQLDRLRTNFVSDVSHELRTPLTAIKGTVETLQDGAVEDAAVRDQFLATIARETERLIRLTNDLLLLSRADAGRLPLTLTTVHMMEAAERARLQMAPLAAKGQVSLTVGGDLDAEAYADSDRVHQVLINLLNNAIAFSTPGGQVSIVVQRERGDVTCTVQDTGIGIAATELPHVFERFYRGDASRARTVSSPDGGGAGLGLAIARVIVEAHGGQIWITSQLGQGTAVTFTLPGRPVTSASSVPSAPST